MCRETAESSRQSEVPPSGNESAEAGATSPDPNAEPGPGASDAAPRPTQDDERRLELAIQTVRHSAGNQLALVSALLSRQARKSPEPAVQQALRTAYRRVNAVAETLRLDGFGAEGEYVSARRLVERVVGSLSDFAASAMIKMEVDVQELPLQRDDAVSFMLIMNELLVNSLRHAFPDDIPGEIRIRFAQESSASGQVLSLMVEDDGIGREPDDARAGLGTTVILAAVQRLGANLVEDRKVTAGKRRGLTTTILKPYP